MKGTRTAWTPTSRVWLAVAAWTVAMPSLAAADPPGPEGTRKCLPPAAGEVVSAFLAGAGPAGVLPPGWKVGPARVQPTEIDLTLISASGERLRLRLSAPGTAGPRLVQAGDHFELSVEARAEPDAAAGLSVARALDSAFSSDPWIDCGQSTRRDDEDSLPEDPPLLLAAERAVRSVPVWAAMALALGQGRLVLLGLVLGLAAFLGPRGTRDDGDSPRFR